MGGVHATMVAALYPEPLALAPLLAPRSAAQSYCQGALFHATAWDRLLRDTEGREAEIVAAVKEAASANEKMAAAKIKGDALEASKRAKLLAETVARIKSQQEEFDSVHAEEKAQQGHWAAVGTWMAEWGSGLENQIRRVRKLEKDSGKNATDRHAAAVLLLEAVLETFTDATRFPVPRRPDAAVLVAATEDAYVSPQSVVDLHRHLPGSEIRWIPGGHVSSFLLHQPTFRSAIVDSLGKLDASSCAASGDE
jgi:pimeloyl-ACP methyl ester carboxylesterase